MYPNDETVHIISDRIVLSADKLVTSAGQLFALDACSELRCGCNPQSASNNLHPMGSLSSESRHRIGPQLRSAKGLRVYDDSFVNPDSREEYENH